jgi:acyl carrier protein
MTQDYQALVIEVARPFVEPGVDLSAETPLEGNLDSMGMVQIILALESRLGRAFAPTDIQFDHFETVATLAQQLSSISSRHQ